MDTCVKCGHELSRTVLHELRPSGDGRRADRADRARDGEDRRAAPDAGRLAQRHRRAARRARRRRRTRRCPLHPCSRRATTARAFRCSPTRCRPRSRLSRVRPRTTGAPRGWVPWAGVAAVLLLVVVGAVWLLGGGDGPGAAGEGTTGPGGLAGNAAAGGKATDVARLASVQVPATAPPNQDVRGNLVTYDGRNMLDGVAQTCWRRPATGPARCSPSRSSGRPG